MKMKYEFFRVNVFSKKIQKFPLLSHGSWYDQDTLLLFYW